MIAPIAIAIAPGLGALVGASAAARGASATFVKRVAMVAAITTTVLAAGFARWAPSAGDIAPSVFALAVVLPLLVVFERAPVRLTTTLGVAAASLSALSATHEILVLGATAGAAVLLAIHARAGGASADAVRRFAVVVGLGAASFVVALALRRTSVELSAIAAVIAAIAWSGAAPFRMGPLLFARSSLVLASAAFLPLGRVVLSRLLVAELPAATRWAAPVVLSYAVIAAVVTSLGASRSDDVSSARAVSVSSLSALAAFATLSVPGFSALALGPPLAVIMVAVATVSGERSARAAHVMVASSGLVGAGLAVLAVAARAPASAVALTVAIVWAARSPARSSGAPRARWGAALVASAVALVALTTTIVDTAVHGRVARLVEVGGDALGE